MIPVGTLGNFTHIYMDMAARCHMRECVTGPKVLLYVDREYVVDMTLATVCRHLYRDGLVKRKQLQVLFWFVCDCLFTNISVQSFLNGKRQISTTTFNDNNLTCNSMCLQLQPIKLNRKIVQILGSNSLLYNSTKTCFLAISLRSIHAWYCKS